MAEEKKESKLVYNENTKVFSFEKDTMTVDEHNHEIFKTMLEFADKLEKALILERQECAKIAVDMGNDEIAKAIFERMISKKQKADD